MDGIENTVFGQGNALPLQFRSNVGVWCCQTQFEDTLQSCQIFTNFLKFTLMVKSVLLGNKPSLITYYLSLFSQLLKASTPKMVQEHPHLPPKRTYLKLISNHMDAWQVALVIATLPVLIHGAIRWQTAVLILAIGVGYWFAFALNDYFDASYDGLEKQKGQRNYFVQVSVHGWVIALFSLVLLAGLAAAFAQFGVVGWLLWGVSCFIAWAYSAPPLRLKMRPGLDLFTHALFVQTFPYFMSMVFIEADWGLLDWVLIAILFLASLTAQLEQQVRDFAVDVQSGGTFTTRMGMAVVLKGLRLATAVCLLIALIAVLNGTIPWFLLPFGLIGLPALLHRFWRPPEKPRSERLVLLSTTAGFVYTGIIFFYFLLS
jgi:4-hydroxybenzoate polyprenyltransferase